MTNANLRSIVYIDGFNLYYGALKGTAYKWLDLDKYFRLLRQNDDVQAIRYFTALVDGSSRTDQQKYLSAINTLPLVHTILGRYKRKQVACGVRACMHAGKKHFDRTEEKQTDVNIALQMLDDAYRGLAERFVLVSGDSDLVPAVNLIKTRFPAINIVLYVPALNAVRGAAVELRASVDKHRTLPNNLFKLAQLPPTIHVGGIAISKPADW